MGVRTKINLGLVAAFLLSIGMLGSYAWNAIQQNARAELIREAQMITAQASAIRGYTVTEIQPLLAEQSRTRFLPHTIPAFAASATERDFSKGYPGYIYKEAALNPTNPGHRATPAETAIINDFRKDAALKSIIRTLDTPDGPVISVSRPLKIGNKACLICHSTPDVAPASMVDVYGTENGYGWSVDETVGAQITSVPMRAAEERARELFIRFMTGAAGIYGVALLLVGIILHFAVGSPPKATA